jgi:hypothetical protein
VIPVRRLGQVTERRLDFDEAVDADRRLEATARRDRERIDGRLCRCRFYTLHQRKPGRNRKYTGHAAHRQRFQRLLQLRPQLGDGDRTDETVARRRGIERLRSRQRREVLTSTEACRDLLTPVV